MFWKHEIQKDISRRGRRERREVKIFVFYTAALILLVSLRSLRTLREEGVSVVGNLWDSNGKRLRILGSKYFAARRVSHSMARARKNPMTKYFFTRYCEVVATKQLLIMQT